MWIFILIVLGLIIGKFAIDNLRLNSAMRQEGGMRIKYAELVDACLACSGARILQETPTFISIGGKFRALNITINYAFWIHHTFNNELIVKYVLKGLGKPQKVVQEWNFAQNISQTDMIKAMRKYLDMLKCNSPANAGDSTHFIGNKFKVLINRLKMDGSEHWNLYNISVLSDTLLEYRFSINMKFTNYTYTIKFGHETGNLQIILDSPTIIKGKWEFPSEMSQTDMADKIEADINEMIIFNH